MGILPMDLIKEFGKNNLHRMTHYSWKLVENVSHNG
jgi:hypothetical protein